MLKSKYIIADEIITTVVYELIFIFLFVTTWFLVVRKIETVSGDDGEAWSLWESENRDGQRRDGEAWSL